jgi:hypothetical protein
MVRNGHALIASSGLTQVIGVFYWVVAARAYPAAVVGRNSVITRWPGSSATPSTRSA